MDRDRLVDAERLVLPEHTAQHDAQDCEGRSVVVVGAAVVFVLFGGVERDGLDRGIDGESERERVGVEIAGRRAVVVDLLVERGHPSVCARIAHDIPDRQKRVGQGIARGVLRPVRLRGDPDLGKESDGIRIQSRGRTGHAVGAERVGVVDATPVQKFGAIEEIFVALVDLVHHRLPFVKEVDVGRAGGDHDVKIERHEVEERRNEEFDTDKDCEQSTEERRLAFARSDDQCDQNAIEDDQGDIGIDTGEIVNVLDPERL